MQLKQIQVQRFGTLRNFNTTFKPGLNVVKGANESGKSTLHQALLMAMVERPAQTKTTSKWRSWDTERWYRLILIFTNADGEQYELERDFETKRETLTHPNGLTTRNRNKIADLLEKTLGTTSSVMLRSTVCIAQDDMYSGKSGGQREITTRLEQVVTGGSENVETQKIIRKLDTKIKIAQRGLTRHAKNPGEIARLRARTRELSAAVAEATMQRDRLHDTRDKLAAAEQRLAKLANELVPLTETLEAANRLHQLKQTHREWEAKENLLLAKLEKVDALESRISQAIIQQDSAGAIAAIDETQLRELQTIQSRILTLKASNAKYTQRLDAYQSKMETFAVQQQEYQAKKSWFDAEIAAYDAQQRTEREQRKAYETAYAIYLTEQRAYDAEEARYKEQRASYERAIATIDAERTKLTDAKDAELALYKDEYATYETVLAKWQTKQQAHQAARVAYEAARAQFDSDKIAWETAQATYQTELADWNAAQKSDTQQITPATTPQSASRLPVGLIVAAIGLVLLGLQYWLLGGVALVSGLAWWFFNRPKQSTAVPATATTSNKPEPPKLEKPEPPSAPEPFVEPLPTAPTLPESSQTLHFDAPALTPPEPLSITKPNPPVLQRVETILKRPVWAETAPIAPAKPIFDDAPLLASAETQLNQMLTELNCTTVSEVESLYRKASTARRARSDADAELAGILGSETKATLEESRKYASRKRRDADDELQDATLQRVNQMSPTEIATLEHDITIRQAEHKTVEAQLSQLQYQLKFNHSSPGELASKQEQLATVQQRYKQAQENLAVDQLTFRLLDAARKKTLEQAQTRLGQPTSKHLARLTHGRYHQVHVASDLSLTLDSPDRADQPIKPDSLSRGAQDQVYLAARLALIDVLYPDANPPILLDDPFVNFDPARHAVALEMLAELAQERQIILFSCSDQYDEIGHLIEMG